jgi:hypothetical protein
MRNVTRSALVAAVVVAAALLAGCSSSSGNSSGTATTAAPTTASTTPTTGVTTTSAATTAGAPCTQKAVLAAAETDTSLGPVDAVTNFGCAGTWAYANVTVGSGSDSFDSVIVLESHGSTWTVGNRETACSDHLVPSSIFTQACTTS